MLLGNCHWNNFLPASYKIGRAVRATVRKAQTPHVFIKHSNCLHLPGSSDTNPLGVLAGLLRASCENTDVLVLSFAFPISCWFLPLFLAGSPWRSRVTSVPGG